MSGLNWTEAVSALLKALGADGAPKERTRAINESLQGTGLQAKRMPVQKSTVSLGGDVAGALFPANDGLWHPILVAGGIFYVLDKTGKPARQIKEIESSNIRGKSWVFFYKDRKQAQTVGSFLRRMKGPLFEIFISGLVINLFSLTLPLFSSFVYDKVLGNGIPETLWALAIGLFLIVLIDFSVHVMRIMAAERFSLSTETDIDHVLFDSLLKANGKTLPPFTSFMDRYKKLLASRDLLSSSYLLSAVDVPFLFLFLSAIAYTGGALVFIPIGYGVIMLLGNLMMSVPVMDYDNQSRDYNEKRFGILNDLLMAHEAIARTHYHNVLETGWRRTSGATSYAQSKVRFWRGFTQSYVSSLNFLSYASMIVGGVYMADAGSLTSGGLLASCILSSRAMNGFASITTLMMRYKDLKLSLRKMDAILPGAPKDIKISRGMLHGALSFNDVSCTLGQNKDEILKDVSFRAVPGEMIGIAGAPGAGKTTFLRLAAGCLLPDKGRVLLDSIPLASLSLDDMANNIGYKPQEICLIEGTVEDNVLAGRASFSSLQREYVLQASGLKMAFDAGVLNWTTEVGARGANLSGGQKQMVALARVLAGAPSVLLLDEPTNGLDVALEDHLAKHLAVRKEKSIILVCTHSRRLLAQCDRIVVIGNNKILADGPRDKILVA